MLTQTVTITQNSNPNIIIGRRGTYETEQVVFDVSWLIDTYGAGSAVLMVHRPTDQTAYPVDVVLDGNTLAWTVSETDTQYKGHGECEIFWYVNGGLAKTCICGITILRDIGDTTETAPDPYETWVETLSRLGAETLTNAQAAAESAGNAAASATGAQQSATDAGNAKTAAVAAAGAAAASASHYPQIVGGIWYVWSPTAGEYISTGIDAQGEDGVSPTVEITAIQGGHRVVITDAEGSHTFDVLDGVTPDLSAYRTAADQDEIDDAQDEQIDDLKSALNTKAGILRDTVSGAVASFVPDSTVPNLLGLSVALEPIQDLHGYDSPWPAGGGKNKFDPSVYSEYVQSDGKYRAKGSQINPIVIPIPTTLLNTACTFSFYADMTNAGTLTNVLTQAVVGGTSKNGNLIQNGSIGRSTVTFTPTSTEDYVHITFGSNGANEFTFYNIQLEASSAVTDFSPYSNICPISGRDSVEIWDDPAYGGLVNWNQFTQLVQSRGPQRGLTLAKTGENTFTINGTATANITETLYFSLIQDMKIPADHKVFTSGFDGHGKVELRFIGNGYRGAFVAITNASVMSPRYGVFSFSLVIPEGTTFNNEEFTAPIICDLTQMFGAGNEPATASAFQALFPKDYYPYNTGEITCVSAVNGNEYGDITIQLGQTVYGGTLDVTNGALTVDRIYIDASTKTWSYNSSAGDTKVFTFTITTIKSAGLISNRFSTDIPSGTPGRMVYQASGNFYAAFPASEISGYDDAAVKTWLATNPTYFVATLKTPIVIDLDPVQIATIANQTNNVWADAGDVSVEFAADLKTYIDSKIAAAVAALS